MSEPEKIGVIVNPHASGGKAGRRWRQIAPVLSARLGLVTARLTSAAGAGSNLARDLMDEGYKLLIAVGGDGTIHEVANGMLEHAGRVPLGVRLGILTLGTGGDFQRTLGLPKKIEDAVEVLATGIAVPLDVGRAQFTGLDGTVQQRYFVNVASFGMGGEVAARARRLHWLGGRAAFLGATLRTLLTHGVRRVRLGLDGESAGRDFRVANVAVGNGGYHAGGMRPCPTALPNDGLLEVTIIEYTSAFRLACDLHVLYSDNVYRHPKIHHLRCRRLAARSDQETGIEIDGEPLGRLPIEIALLEKRLPVVVPRTSPLAAGA